MQSRRDDSLLKQNLLHGPPSTLLPSPQPLEQLVAVLGGVQGHGQGAQRAAGRQRVRPGQAAGHLQLLQVAADGPNDAVPLLRELSPQHSTNIRRLSRRWRRQRHSLPVHTHPWAEVQPLEGGAGRAWLGRVGRQGRRSVVRIQPVAQFQAGHPGQRYGRPETIRGHVDQRHFLRVRSTS